MPKKDIDYSKTIIYKLVCLDLIIKDIYVGHTTNFIKRKNSHKHSCKGTSVNSNCNVYSVINLNGGWDNWTMIEIEKYPCSDLNEACARERYYYELLNANLNDRSPHNRLVPNSERCKEWRNTNGIITCECGKELSRSNLSRHKKICHFSSSSSLSSSLS